MLSTSTSTNAIINITSQDQLTKLIKSKPQSLLVIDFHAQLSFSCSFPYVSSLPGHITSQKKAHANDETLYNLMIIFFEINIDGVHPVTPSFVSFSCHWSFFKRYWYWLIIIILHHHRHYTYSGFYRLHFMNLWPRLILLLLSQNVM